MGTGRAQKLPVGLRGLSAPEAQARLARFGPNRLAKREQAAWLKERAGVLLDPMALMLLVAAAVYRVVGEARDAMVMLLALVPVLGVDVFLEARSRAALRRLSERVAAKARVVRDGVETDVATVELVPGELLVVREGDVLHADGVVRWAASLGLDESSLTGEAEPQPKHAGAERPEESAVYAGARELTGQGYIEIDATGSRTRYGEIARLLSEVEASATPLQRRTGKLVRQLAVAAVVVAALVLLLGRARGLPWPRALLGAVSLAIAAIPEEFPLVFTLFLSVGAWRLSRRGVLIRRLPSVETLGSTTMICVDKTGTLTRGEFVVDAEVVLAADGPALREAAVLTCEWEPADPMERALLAHAAQRGAAAADLRARWSLVRDYDFDPVGKHMAHVWAPAAGGGVRRVVAKGALEGILEHCALSPAERATAEAENARLAGQAMRVLAIAERRWTGPGHDRADDEKELTLLGLIGFRDPLRPEVRAAVEECRAAGVKIKLITGDHPLTAQAVAEEAGIGRGAVATGPELAALDDRAHRERILAANVFARISPAQKHAIVKALQDAGEIVAMTGDGINDAPALRRADIGVSMGIRGTEVARAAADMVLLDDNFASLVAAIREGRHIFDDLQRAFLYLIGFHMPVVGLALLTPLWGAPLLLLPVHLVWLELIVHPVSALAFGAGERADVMRRPPRRPSAPLLPSARVALSATAGALLTAATFATYVVTLASGVEAARSRALAVLLIGVQLLVLAEVGGRGRPLLPRSLRFWLVWTIAAATLPAALYWPPLAGALHVQGLSVTAWAMAATAATLAVGWRLALPKRV